MVEAPAAGVVVAAPAEPVEAPVEVGAALEEELLKSPLVESSVPQFAF